MRKRPLRVLISAGPTREPLDPVRFISNYSTGYMCARLAAEALARGHRVTVVSGPSAEPLPPKARRIAVEQAAEMERTMRWQSGSADVIIMAAAVSDLRPVRRFPSKLPRIPRALRLQATPDIISRLPRRSRQLVVGFALETDRVLAHAQQKLRAKRLDLLLAQQGTPFGRRKVRAWLLERCSQSGLSSRQSKLDAVQPLGVRSKAEIARVLLDKIEALWYGQRQRRD